MALSQVPYDQEHAEDGQSALSIFIPARQQIDVLLDHDVGTTAAILTCRLPIPGLNRRHLTAPLYGGSVLPPTPIRFSRKITFIDSLVCSQPPSSRVRCNWAVKRPSRDLSFSVTIRYFCYNFIEGGQTWPFLESATLSSEVVPKYRTGC